MAISKVIFKASAEATPEVWMDATPATAGAADITAPKTAMLADGVLTTGTGSGGGGSSYTLLASKDITINTSSSTATEVDTVSLGSGSWISNKIIYVKIRDKAGPRNGYFLGGDYYYFNYQAANNSTSALGTSARATVCQYVSPAGSYSTSTGGYGVYSSSISYNNGNPTVPIMARYSASIGAVDGTYNVAVYTLDYAPAQGNPFDYSFA